MTEKIVIALAERDGMVVSTTVAEVEKILWGHPTNTFYWKVYYGQNKDQSPTGYGVNSFEPHPKFPGLFQTVEILDHWDGPTSKTEIDAIMTIVTIRLSENRVKKENLPAFIKQILKATYFQTETNE